MKKKIIHHLQLLLSIAKPLVHYILLFLLLLIVLVGLLYPNYFEKFLEILALKINNLGNWNYFFVGLCGIIESLPLIGVFFPGQNIIMLISVFFGKNNIVPLIIIATLSVFVGHYIGFILGKKYGIKFIDQYGSSVGFKQKQLEYLEKQIEKHGGIILIFCTFYNMTRALVPFLAGAMKMDKKKFILYNFIGSFLWATVVIIVGVIFSNYYNLIIKKLPIILMIFIIIFIIYLIIKRLNTSNKIEKG